ncbi:MAG: FAD-dependent oxidoreductase, partial [Oscillibacter sp.]|nr:FAD-dependent oxidoreductase [Oscillibacter sp.]
MQREFHNADLLIIGGGTAGCYAAITAARRAPEVSVLLIEKADIRRSGCLAAGVNALNAYIPDGRTPEEYVDYVRRDAEIIRDDLVLSMAERFNACAADLERMGLVILKDAEGKYATRGRWNLKINGENIKPLLAAEVGRYPNITVLNHVNVTDYLISQGRVCGAVGFSVREETAY